MLDEISLSPRNQHEHPAPSFDYRAGRSSPYSAAALTIGNRSAVAPSPHSCTKPEPALSGRYTRTHAVVAPNSSIASGCVTSDTLSGYSPRNERSSPHRRPTSVGYATLWLNSMLFMDTPSKPSVRLGFIPSTRPVESRTSAPTGSPIHTTFPPALR